MTRQRVLVAGATGLVGKAVAEHLLQHGEADVVAVSRRNPHLPGALHIAVDLTDLAACKEMLSGLNDITHIVFAALYEKPDLIAGWRERGDRPDPYDVGSTGPEEAAALLHGEGRRWRELAS